MQDRQLTVHSLFRHGATIYPDSQVALFDGERVLRRSYHETAERIAKLAGALRRLGIRPLDRVATFCWNTAEHLEAYLAVPSMGAVLHTLNLRLFPDQLAYIVNHAEDRVILVDESLAPVLAKAASQFKTVERYIVIGKNPGCLPGECLDYEELLAAGPGTDDWPQLDERAAAVMCYTSGTTGNPKGVVYSHRSIYLHSLCITSANCMGLSQSDRVLVVTAMFHANSWGLPHAAWLAGSDCLFPGRFLQGDALCRLIATERPTISSGVPTIWSDVLRYADAHPMNLSSLRLVLSGGSAVPRTLIESFQSRHGVRIVQAWGMTELSPLGVIANASKTGVDHVATAGRVLAGVELRIVDDEGRVLPTDGVSVGEIQARGPWVTGAYYGENIPEKFQDGWLRTGDVGTLDRQGYLQVKDRSKDVIKSGGEWISSIDLENAIMAHPDVMEAAVVGVPDPRWDERPLACVVLKEGTAISADDLRAFLADRVVKWWIPDHWAFLDEIPKTSVGKFDKKRLRAERAAGRICVSEAGAD
ncbi:MAG TPA: long-chain fatty acid--CoA ligase [Bryobacteraceae bacterium]|nr:long-chain fatty acid--CoA ligase [Bryobacteraceae bacterium]